MKFTSRFLYASLISAMGLCSSAIAGEPHQTVFLDFDSETTFVDRDAGNDYSAFERQAILSKVREDYEMFNFYFTLTQPTEGDYSTIFLNASPGPGAFGVAEKIDFRNLDKNDTALVDIPASRFPTNQARVLKTADTVAHELGHILGLRHLEGFGPIGSGVNPTSFFVPGFDFPGLEDAAESSFHIMNTDPDNGFPYDVFFGERSAVKLAFNEGGSVVSELAGSNGAMETAEPLVLETLEVPNTLRVGQFEGQDFQVNALTVLGSVSLAANESTDFFSFQANAGDILNVEVISDILRMDTMGNVLDRLPDSIAPRLSVFDSNGEPLDYFGQPAVNDAGPESADAILFDLMIPETGDYFVSVEGGGASDSDGTPEEGDYELFLYTFGVDSGFKSLSDGDFNGDGSVDALDFTFFRDNLGTEVSVGAGADGNANGLIDPEDYRYWLGNFGNEYGTSGAVPEPAGFMLLAIASAWLSGVKRSR